MAAARSESGSVRDLLERARAAEHVDPASARSLIQHARSIAHAGSDHHGESEALYRLASLSYYAGRADEAFAVAVEARDLALEHGHHLVVAWALNLLGIVHLGAGNYSEALQCCLQSVDRYRMTDHRIDEGNHLNTVATVYNALGDTDRAIVTLEAALAANRELDRPDFDAITLANMASLRTERQEYLLAVSLGEQALEMARRHAVSFIPQILTALGRAYIGIGDPEWACTLLREALDTLAEGDEAEVEAKAGERAVTLIMLGRACAARQDHAAAVSYLDQGLVEAVRAGARLEQLELHTRLAEVHKEAGDFECAAHHLEARFDVNQQLFNDGTDLRIRTLQIAHDTEQARQQAEILRLRTTELQQLVDGRTSALEEFQLTLLERVAMLGSPDPDRRRTLDRAVGNLSARLAGELQMPHVWVEQLRSAARLRDLGEVEGAAETGREHTEIGAALLEGSPSNTVRLAAEIARTHHEHWDGTGRPRGLEGIDIPASGRIVAVAEAFCAALPILREGSGNLDGMASEESLAQVIAHSGTLFDPDVVRALLAVMEREHPLVVNGLRHLAH